MELTAIENIGSYRNTVYHGFTKLNHAQEALENGFRFGDGSAGQGVYFALNLEDARYWGKYVVEVNVQLDSVGEISINSGEFDTVFNKPLYGSGLGWDESMAAQRKLVLDAGYDALLIDKDMLVVYSPDIENTIKPIRLIESEGTNETYISTGSNTTRRQIPVKSLGGTMKNLARAIRMLGALDEMPKAVEPIIDELGQHAAEWSDFDVSKLDKEIILEHVEDFLSIDTTGLERVVNKNTLVDKIFDRACEIIENPPGQPDPRPPWAYHQDEAWKRKKIREEEGYEEDEYKNRLEERDED